MCRSEHTYVHLPPYTVCKLTAGSRCILLLSISTLHNYFHSIMTNSAIMNAGDGPGITAVSLTLLCIANYA